MSIPELALGREEKMKKSNKEKKTNNLNDNEHISCFVSYPKIDSSLFRYRPLNGWDKNKEDKKLGFLLNEIEAGEIYLSTISDLNDPFETQNLQDINDNNTFNYHRMLQIVQNLSKEPSLYGVVADKITNKIDCNTGEIRFDDFVEASFKPFRKICKKIKNKKEYKEVLQKEYQKKYPSKITNVLIASFSETEKSIPMWAYYTNNHKGVCLEYDFTKILKKDIENIVPYFYKVSYSLKMPTNKYNEIYSPTVKGIDWSHEREWRLVFLKDSNKIIRKNNYNYVHVPYLKGVIYGANISAHQASQIEKTIDKINKKRSKSKQIYIKQAKPLSNKYGIIISKEKIYTNF